MNSKIADCTYSKGSAKLQVIARQAGIGPSPWIVVYIVDSITDYEIFVGEFFADPDTSIVQPTYNGAISSRLQEDGRTFIGMDDMLAAVASKWIETSDSIKQGSKS